MNPFLFVDVETTGLDPVRHEVIEIGAILTTPDLEVLRSFEVRIDPTRPQDADPKALAVNGWTPGNPRWNDAVPAAEACRRLVEFLADTKPHPVGKNVAFDVSFLQALASGCGGRFPFHYRTFDLTTLSLPLVVAGVLEVNGLDSLVRLLGLSRKGSHEALEDCELTLEAFRRLLPLFARAARESFASPLDR